MENVVWALKADVPIGEMAVLSEKQNHTERIPLDVYLAGVRDITEADAFFTTAPSFNIWVHLPHGLEKRYDWFDLDKEEAQRLLERFNAYTWREKEPEAMKSYMESLKTLRWVIGDSPLGAWNLGYHRPIYLSGVVDRLVQRPEFEGLSSVQLLKTRAGELSTLESQLREIPPERIRDFFTFSGWGRMTKRDRMVVDMGPKVKSRARDLLGPITQLGAEYRKKFVAEYYPHLA